VKKGNVNGPQAEACGYNGRDDFRDRLERRATLMSIRPIKRLSISKPTL
jgi:hypothetical protein